MIPRLIKRSSRKILTSWSSYEKTVIENAARCITTSEYGHIVDKQTNRTFDITPSDYDYQLPEDRIALSPTTPRDASKLLVAVCGSGTVIADSTFRNLDKFLPDNAVLISNDSKVIAARLFMRKVETGGLVEVLCLDPITKTTLESLEAVNSCEWLCFVRGKNVKPGTQLFLDDMESPLKAEIQEKYEREALIRFTWNSGREYKFRDILEKHGIIPLPPYMKRNVTKDDRTSYQTVYATNEGSVAAPTAGLHFTPQLLSKLEQKNVSLVRVTLHVGAGTFSPIVTESVSKHDMHDERFHVTLTALKQLKENCQQSRPFVAVGTTSVRTLETLYWIGYQLITSEDFRSRQCPTEDLSLSQWFPYERESSLMQTNTSACNSHLPTRMEILDALISWLEERACDSIMGRTKLIIVPNYPFFMVDAMITNFHQPRSTLLMLVAAFLGDRSALFHVYRHALEHDYRFLSYGDGSLLASPVFFANNNIDIDK
ncbi:S-adenosylmethionine:tRNA ribosyltransferase-isomerase [Galdieria sulphuraria]|uniref:S-adenosylmethionine:tRNA ribosyltransferase-isomerase n=1 Tax=Galdieria sulphuraria TaxID=130081 RepID=M2Y1W3_GALSU|nr:S-adenosylmethionine:tRNA ribosyltransferase-isomerase [Galdieria sulphuraria]EME29933.1 S-adenosylmethionine:tRNA ribosyltransferase-isomerase [Galdieria sulphuraria]GJD11984.1 S-adenosylmethionine:tRNA ribosyltransferase-isomerase [Galdieria sulphuraria]|eukprot:XP_005706453.1 S-adenosylmethionine:tRNA ribosyltransferase-isomerase [Galdieria sulphuraria]